MNNTLPELGDASIAAAFTYKYTKLTSVIDVIRQGRQTLVNTQQMYKILSLGSLIRAFSMSVLYIDGVKLSDYQNTSIGISLCFLIISFSMLQPLEKLTKERIPSSIFHWSFVTTIILQFAVHMVLM